MRRFRFKIAGDDEQGGVLLPQYWIVYAKNYRHALHKIQNRIKRASQKDPSIAYRLVLPPKRIRTRVNPLTPWVVIALIAAFVALYLVLRN